jgi:hypothetical protein
MLSVALQYSMLALVQRDKPKFVRHLPMAECQLDDDGPRLRQIDGGAIGRAS